MNYLLYILISLIAYESIGAMQQPARVYNPEKTNMLKSLLNIYAPREKLPEKEIVGLVSAGADPDVKADCGYCINNNWLSILTFCYIDNAENLISFLLHNGADPNGSGPCIYPLISACSEGKYANAALLIAAGANLRVRSLSGNCPLYLALGDPTYPKLYRNSIIKLLLEKGAAADIHATNGTGESAFSYAQKNGMRDILELFEKYKHIKP